MCLENMSTESVYRICLENMSRILESLEYRMSQRPLRPLSEKLLLHGGREHEKFNFLVRGELAQ